MGQNESAELPAHLQRVHMVGIGGAGMSGLARILLARGGAVSGSDAKDGRAVLALRTRGAVVTIGHDPSALDSLPDGPTVVVSTRAAIPDSNPELVEARERGIEVVMRPAVLATLMSGYRTLLVAGTHGKTSTTSMAVAALQHSGADPSFAVGGELNESGTNAHHGSGTVFVAEADESDGSLLEYPASVVVITNIEADHLDFFGSEAAYVEVFDKFVGGVESGGVVVACVDDPGVRAMLERTEEALTANDVSVWGYGHHVGGGAQRPDHVVAELMEFTTGPDGGISRVRLYPPLVDEVSELRLVTPMPGVHMALNALAAVLAGHAVLGQSVPLAQIAEGIAEFSGVRRRFEYRGSADGVRVYDDYAHHPTEVRAVLSAARATAGDGRVVAVFQPHLYSRTQEFAREFATALRLADEVIVADVYGAREEPLPGVNGGLIAAHMRGRGRFVPDLSELVPAVLDVVAPGDIVLTLGAGDITMQGPEILAALGERE